MNVATISNTQTINTPKIDITKVRAVVESIISTEVESMLSDYSKIETRELMSNDKVIIFRLRELNEKLASYIESTGNVVSENKIKLYVLKLLRYMSRNVEDSNLGLILFKYESQYGSAELENPKSQGFEN